MSVQRRYGFNTFSTEPQQITSNPTLTDMDEDPIFVAIEEGRFSSAKLDLAAKLKRFPDKSYYLALNCYFLAQSGNLSSAEAQCQRLKAKTPSDTQSLEILSRTFLKLGRPVEANEVYENAVRKYPSTDLLVTWFSRNLRLFDTRNVQKAAMILRKHAKSNRSFAVRAAFVNYLWSTQCPLEKEAVLTLNLAEQILAELSPLKSNQEIFVQTAVFEKLQKYKEIVQLLKPLEQRELELIIAFLNALDKTEEWDVLYLACHKLIFEEEFNDYNTWQYLIKAAKNLGKPKETVSELIKLGSRNSYMASIEIAKVYQSDTEAALLSYYGAFASKPCCIYDLSLIDLPNAFYEKVESDFSTLMAKDALSEKEACALSNAVKIKLRQNAAAEISWSDFSKFDNLGLNDIYLICMIRDLEKDNSPKAIVGYIVYLEHLAKKDPENFKIKLWLINLYTSINASSMAVKIYKELKIKMIQHDTLSYKLDLEPSLGNLNELVQIYRFYLTSDSEVEEYVQKGFEKELYSKLQDFFQFGKRLATSLSRHLLILRIIQTSRMLNHSYYNYFYKVLADSRAEILADSFTVSDNRDFTTDYNLGCDLPRLQIFENSECKRGKEYAKLYYLKELLIVETNGTEVAKLLKLFNKTFSNPQTTKQLSPFENHLFKLYLSLFKTTKGTNEKDKALELSYLVKNIDFKKLRPKFLDTLPGLSNKRNHVLVGAVDLCQVCLLLLNQPQLVKAAKQLQKDLAAYNASAGQIEILQKIKSENSFADLAQDFVDDRLEYIEEGLKKSIFKTR